MSPDFLAMGLWQPFVQASRWSQGAGLGMSICQGIVRRMNGTLEVESVLGEGTSAWAPRARSQPG
jgi:signal transduction histidine kinase